MDTKPLVDDARIDALVGQIRQAAGWRAASEVVAEPVILDAIRQAVREAGEAAAKVMDERAAAWDENPPDGQEREWDFRRDEARSCAAAIRERL